jgi:hypothetical protein
MGELKREPKNVISLKLHEGNMINEGTQFSHNVDTSGNMRTET